MKLAELIHVLTETLESEGDMPVAVIDEATGWHEVTTTEVAVPDLWSHSGSVKGKHVRLSS